MSRMELDGRNVVITGSNSGIGMALLRILAARGNRIVAADLRTGSIEALGMDNVVPLVCDVSTEEGVDRLFSESASALGTIDVLFCNAGFPYYERVGSPDWDRVDRIFRTNTIAHIYAYERFVEHLAGREGRMCLTVSAMGQVSMPGFAVYSATKYAMNGFQDAIQFETPSNITVTSSFPVSTNTNFFKVASENEMKKPFPVQTPEHVARRMIRATEKGRREVYPSRLFHLCKVVFVIVPPIKWGYRRFYRNRMLRDHPQ